MRACGLAGSSARRLCLTCSLPLQTGPQCHGLTLVSVRPLPFPPVLQRGPCCGRPQHRGLHLHLICGPCGPSHRRPDWRAGGWRPGSPGQVGAELDSRASLACNLLLGRRKHPPDATPAAPLSPTTPAPAQNLALPRLPPCSTSGTPEGVDSIVPLLFTILDEGASPLLPDSMKVR